MMTSGNFYDFAAVLRFMVSLSIGDIEASEISAKLFRSQFVFLDRLFEVWSNSL